MRSTFTAPFLLTSLAGLLLMGFAQPWAAAESLFRSPAEGLHPYAGGPRMLFSSPRPQQVGDLVTITIDETASRSSKSQVQIQKQSQLEDDTLSTISDAANTVASNFGLGGLAKYLKLPSIGQSNSRNQNQSQANATQTSALKDKITCEVVQVLPNGNLMVQGRKAFYMAKERTDMYVTGIVNPYFLSSDNAIDSAKVANFQVMVSGKGMMSRVQNDGLAGKALQFLQ